MNNIDWYLFIWILSLYHKVYGSTTKFLNTNYSLDTVKNAEIVKCSGDSACPHYSAGCHVMDMDIHSNTYGSGYCNLAFICRPDKNCVVELKEDLLFSDNTHNYLSTQTYTLKEGFSKIEDDLFVSSCSVDDINQYSVSTESNSCNTDTNCYSGKCQNGICISDSNNPTYHCYLDYPDTTKAPIIKCDVIDQLKCDNNRCSSNYCNYFKKNDIYTGAEIDSVYKNFYLNYFVYAFILMLTLMYTFIL
ncbi:hypothetical protein PIROE2DRAFT_60273 [Piromyces sp. E2]|nr:hypothetical protein PIROE2DRAFT_60273 [Piromyces sp. E2]|eukprot:OUM65040.1 hypothetical protein PIROE2DRAFT_60273 [Piromyces sp. E2]